MKTLSLTLWLVLTLEGGACAIGAQDPDDVRAQRADSAKDVPGKREFQQTCGFCHGPDGRGASGPDLLRSPLVNHDVNGNLIGQVVRSGRPEKGMPSFQLPEVEIRAIADFLHAEAHTAASVSQRVPTEYPVEKLLVGSAGAGKTYFQGPGHCSECHSTERDLAHIASKYKPIDLQSRIAFPSGAESTATVTDREGRTFSGTLVFSDEFAVSLRDQAGWVHSWKRTEAKVDIHDPLAAHVKLLTTYTDKDLHNLFAYLETLK